MQIMFDNDFPLKKRASYEDYSIKKKEVASLGNPNKLEKKDVSVKGQIDLPSLNEKRPLPPKPKDHFGNLEDKLESGFEKQPVKKVKTSPPEHYLNKTLPLENKPQSNESLPSLKQLFQNTVKPSEPEKKNFEFPSFGSQKPSELSNKPKPPHHSMATPHQHKQANMTGNTFASGEFISNKLKYLPHVQSKESKFGNFVVPVLPSFLTEGQ